MTLPNFLIVGAAKCGTTTLFHCVKQHPDVGMLEAKDAYYFVHDRKKVETLSEYEALFEGFADRKAVGEAPVRCLYDPDAPGKIKRDLPGVKIVIILRNPAEMAHSLWGHMVRNGEKLSFRQGLKEEPKRIGDPAFRLRSNNWHGDYYYFDRGLYFRQVKRYMDMFGRENVQVHLFEDFRKDPAGTCSAIFRFIGVDPGFVPVMERRNTGRVFRHRGLHKLLTQPPAWLSRASSCLPARMTAGVRDRLIDFNTQPVPALDRGLKRELLERYRPDIVKLEGLIGRDLSVWLKDI